MWIYSVYRCDDVASFWTVLGCLLELLKSLPSQLVAMVTDVYSVLLSQFARMGQPELLVVELRI